MLPETVKLAKEFYRDLRFHVQMLQVWQVIALAVKPGGLAQ